MPTKYGRIFHRIWRASKKHPDMAGAQEGNIVGLNTQEFFREATMRICGSLDMASALWRFFSYAKEFIPLNQITLNLFEPDMGAVRVVAGATQAGGTKLDIVSPLSPKARSDLKGDKLTKLRIVNEPEKDQVSRDMAEVMGKSASSLLIMRLEVEGRRLGSVVLRCDGKNRYTTEHSELLSLLNEPFAIALSNFLRHQEVVELKNILADDNRFLHKELRSISGEEIIGQDFGLRSVMDMVRQVAPLDSPVLLLGETGVGKEVIANAIHYSSGRSEGPFIKVNCGAIPETLLDSELFGHEKGAFTGAVSQRRGRFERASGGTIFLDEIGELRAEAQVKLLRVLQNKEIERVGGTHPLPVDIRIIAATHRDLKKMVAEGQFREDLWYRLNVFPLMIPPLRERKIDIPTLVSHFVNVKSREMGLHPVPTLAPGAIDILTSYEWPGNVRELENMVERALIMAGSGPLSFIELQGIGRTEQREEFPLSPRSFPSIDEVMAGHIRRALQIASGRVEGEKGAAKLLGLKPSTLRNRMNKLGISYGRKERE